MLYYNVTNGSFVKRLNRFSALAEIQGMIQTVHVKTTGRCQELFLPGVSAFFEKSGNPARKTAYSLIAVEKNGKTINVDSQIPNAVVEEGIKNGTIILPFLTAPLLSVRREVTRGHSRFDFLLNTDNAPVWIEVKGVTLEDNGIAMFPDAPTLRGLKHLRELTEIAQSGGSACMIFLIQMNGIHYFTPNKTAQPEFAQALLEARNCGVHLLAYCCNVTGTAITASYPVEIHL